MSGAFLRTGRMAAYGGTSTLAATAVVLTALRSRSNFYSAAVMLGRSNGGMLVLLNFGVFLSLAAGRLLQKVFFGPLRAIELEHLHERMWYAVTESLLAMTIFRSEFDTSFVFLFGSLLLLKAFHWLTADRVDFMEQSPTIPRFFHARMASVQLILLTLDLLLVTFTVEVLLLEAHRMGMMIMFASEFAILLANMLAITAKYIINCIDLRRDEPWEGKSMWVFAVDLVTDFLKLAVYLTFFAMILTFYGLPLNIIRDVYITGRSFVSKIRDLLRYRAATRNMDDRYPSATAADMGAMSDGTCIICREDMLVSEASSGGDPSRPAQTYANGLNMTPKKLPCGHIFHFHCLRAWLERQQTCPTCRRTVFTDEQAQAQAQAQAQQAQEQQQQQQQEQAGRDPQLAHGQAPQTPQAGVGGGDDHTPTPTTPAGAPAPYRGGTYQGQHDAARRSGLSTPDILSRTTSLGPASGSVFRNQQQQQQQQYQQASAAGPSRNSLQAFFRSHGLERPPSSAAGYTPAPGTAARDQFAFEQPRPALREPSAFGGGAGGAGRLRPPERVPIIQGGEFAWTDRRSLVASSSGSAARTPSSSREASSSDAEAAHDDEAQEQEPDEPQLDPREAARLAALRRFGQSSSGPSSSGLSDKALGKQAAPTAAPAARPGVTLTPLELPARPLHEYAALLADEEAPLSQEQLQQMSQLTREGIQHRLRVLHRIDQQIWDSVQELTQCLSVLPSEQAQHLDDEYEDDASDEAEVNASQ